MMRRLVQSVVFVTAAGLAGCAGDGGPRIYVMQDAALIPYGCQAPDLAIVRRWYTPQFKSTEQMDLFFLFGPRSATITTLDGKTLPEDATYVAVNNGPHTATFDNKASSSFVAIAPFVYAAPPLIGGTPNNDVIQLGLEPSFIAPDCEPKPR